jgi:hypothetical protein
VKICKSCPGIYFVIVTVNQHLHFSLFQDGYTTTLPPDWVNDVDTVNATIVDIQSLMSELASMHASRIGTVFGRDLDNMEKQIERKTREVTGAFKGRLGVDSYAISSLNSLYIHITCRPI